MDKIYITAAGYLDDMLHIQLAVRDKTTLDTHGYLYLTDREGNRVDSYSSIFLWKRRRNVWTIRSFCSVSPKKRLRESISCMEAFTKQAETCRETGA